MTTKDDGHSDLYAVPNPKCPHCKREFSRWAHAKRHVKFCTGSKRTMIDRSKYAGDSILRSSNFKSGETVTIVRFREIKTALRDRPIQPALELSGYPEKFLPLNATNLDFLIAAFSNDESKWPDKKVTVRIISTQTPDGDPAEGIRLEKVAK